MSRWAIVDYRPPFANHMFRNWSVVLNGIPTIAQWARDRVMRDQTYELARYLDGALLRYLGSADQEADVLRGALYNPVGLLARGARFIIALPVLFLLEIGLVSSKIFGILVDNFVTRLLGALFGIVALAASLITIFAGWEAAGVQLTKLMLNAHLHALFGP